MTRLVRLALLALISANADPVLSQNDARSETPADGLALTESAQEAPSDALAVQSHPKSPAEVDAAADPWIKTTEEADRDQPKIKQAAEQPKEQGQAFTLDPPTHSAGNSAEEVGSPEAHPKVPEPAQLAEGLAAVAAAAPVIGPDQTRAEADGAPAGFSSSSELQTGASLLAEATTAAVPNRASAENRTTIENREVAADVEMPLQAAPAASARPAPPIDKPAQTAVTANSAAAADIATPALSSAENAGLAPELAAAAMAATAAAESAAPDPSIGEYASGAGNAAPVSEAPESSTRPVAEPESVLAEDVAGMEAEIEDSAESPLEGLQVRWSEAAAGAAASTAVPAPPALPKVSRLVSDDELAIAAANVRKSWMLLDAAGIDALVEDAGLDSLGAPMRVAMLASVIAEIVSQIDAVSKAGKPLVYIRGRSVTVTTTTTTTSSAAPLALSKLAQLPLALPLGLANRAGQALISSAQSRAQPAPQPRTSPFSSLWPSGAQPRMQAEPRPPTPPAFSTGAYPALSQTAWNLYQSLVSPRKLSEAEDAQTRERFGNFLHDELPREVKRKIWEDFVADSRRAKSADEQNALLRRLERGRARTSTEAPSAGARLLVEATKPRLVTVGDSIGYAAEKLRTLIKSGDFTVAMIEGARLYLATLEHSSQTDLMDLLIRASGKDDVEFIEFKNTHDIDSDLQIGLLLLTRLQNALA